MDDALILQAPTPSSDAGSELLLLFHGVGSSAEDLRPLGEALAARRPRAWVVSIRSPEPSDFGQGWQWFSVQGITDASRPARVQAALPRFLQTVAAWQARAGVEAEATTLIGFSQGAIMALESTQVVPSPAGRVVAIAGRFAHRPTVAPEGTAVHLMHGELDGVMPVALAVQAAQALQALGAAVTLDRFAGLGHGIDGRVLGKLLERLDQGKPGARHA